MQLITFNFRLNLLRFTFLKIILLGKLFIELQETVCTVPEALAPILS